MKMLSVNTGWQTHRVIMLEDDVADIAYETLKAAIESYERFGNDKQKAVSIKDGKAIGEMTFRIDQLISVHIEDLGEDADELHVQTAARNERLKTKIKLPVVATVHPPDETGLGLETQPR